MPYVYFLLHNNVTCCVFLEATTTVLESFPNSTGKQGPFFPQMMKLYKLYKDYNLFCMDKSGSPFSECESCKWGNSLANVFLQSTFEANEMFFLLTKFVIFTTRKPALKITAGQRSLTIVKTFATTKKLGQTVTMTAAT